MLPKATARIHHLAVKIRGITFLKQSPLPKGQALYAGSLKWQVLQSQALRRGPGGVKSKPP